MVAPLFFLLIFGMIEFGRMIMVQQLLVAASREGGREAMLDGTTSNAVITRVRDYLTNTSIDGAAATVTVTPDPASAETGTEVTVTVSIPFENVSWFADPWYLDGVNLRAACVMRHE
jgi:Flp pilus assembly protein TadG